MSDRVKFLVYVVDPFRVRDSVCCIYAADEGAKEIKLSELAQLDGPVLSLYIGYLLDELRQANFGPPAQLIDIGDALRLSEGRPKDEGGEQLWDTWKSLAKVADSSTKVKALKDIFHSKSLWPSRDVLVSETMWLAETMANLWRKTSEKLTSQDELRRFEDVEIPIRGIFNHRQIKGICVNKDNLAELLRKVASEKYSAFLRIAPAIGRSPQSANYWNLTDYLAGTELNHLSNEKDGGSLRDSLRLASSHSTLAQDFLDFIDAGRDETTLKRCLSNEGRVFPIFSTMGTVTGRILVSEPSLQQLRRPYRQVIEPTPDHYFIYLDYAQFEPGVVAFLSNDKEFIDRYNEGDLYSSLSVHLYGSVEKRKLCKRVFLAYCYGMSEEALSKLLLPSDAGEDQRKILGKSIETFFSTFRGLRSLKEQCQSDLSREGLVSSLFGNRRYRVHGGSLTAKERRWALNQRVQATASLIFKEALVRIVHKFGADSVVLPMHDAILLEIPANYDFAKAASDASVELRAAFESRLPGVISRVTCEDFTHSQ